MACNRRKTHVQVCLSRLDTPRQHKRMWGRRMTAGSFAPRCLRHLVSVCSRCTQQQVRKLCKHKAPQWGLPPAMWSLTNPCWKSHLCKWKFTSCTDSGENFRTLIHHGELGDGSTGHAQQKRDPVHHTELFPKNHHAQESCGNYFQLVQNLLHGCVQESCRPVSVDKNGPQCHKNATKEKSPLNQSLTSLEIVLDRVKHSGNRHHNWFLVYN